MKKSSVILAILLLALFAFTVTSVIAWYKKDVKDLRKSPSVKLIEILQGQHCRVDYFDPIIPYLSLGAIQAVSVKLTKEELRKYDCVVIATDHTGIDYPLIRKHARLIFDIRNVYGETRDKKIVKF